MIRGQDEINTLKDRREAVQWLANRNAVWKFLGCELVDAEPGRTRLKMTVKPEHSNSFNYFHGGLIFTLADLTFGFTCNAAGVRSVTAGSTIDFLAPVEVGDVLISEAKEIYRQGRNGLYDTRLWREKDGVVVAIVQGRMRIVGRPGQPQGE
jgi:acyl-CoA thioesterase